MHFIAETLAKCSSHIVVKVDSEASASS